MQSDINTNNSSQANARGQELVDDILTNPDTEIIRNERGGWDAIDPDGKVIRFNKDGSMQGFRE